MTTLNISITHNEPFTIVKEQVARIPEPPVIRPLPEPLAAILRGGDLTQVIGHRPIVELSTDERQWYMDAMNGDLSFVPSTIVKEWAEGISGERWFVPMVNDWIKAQGWRVTNRKRRGQSGQRGFFINWRMN